MKQQHFTNRERLIRKAERHLETNTQIPADLFAELMKAGVDVSAIERNYR